MKILIWDYQINIKNSGGPAGYLYNIKSYIDKHKREGDTIVFLKDLLNIPNSDVTLHQKYSKGLSWINKYDKLKIFNLLNGFRGISAWYKKPDKSIFENIDFNQFDIIHFHVCYHVLAAKNILKDFKGKIVLTTHSPQPLSEEMCTFPKPYSFINKIVYSILRRRELKSWEYVDNMLFPVKEAVEVYFSDANLKTFIQNNKEKLVFVPTSLNVKEEKDRRDIRKELNIPEDAFILCYIGRHNEIKGYDKLLEFGKKYLDSYPNLYIVVGGNTSPLYPISHPRWKELGWINYGQDLIYSSDAFILPNKQTYFDLIALEVLREGTPLILSRTGGNKYFESMPSIQKKGLFFYNYDDLSNVENIIKHLMNLKTNNQIEDLRTDNVSLFLSEFTVPTYLKKYLDLMSTIK